MFSALVTTVVLAGSIAMPVAVDNPWAANNWEPLKIEYQNCVQTSVSRFSVYVCTTKAYTVATTNLQKV